MPLDALIILALTGIGMATIMFAQAVANAFGREAPFSPTLAALAIGLTLLAVGLGLGLLAVWLNGP